MDSPKHSLEEVFSRGIFRLAEPRRVKLGVGSLSGGGKATKGVWWMPWQKLPRKGVASDETPRGAASRL